MTERSRRDAKPKLDRLAEYKRTREGGKRVLKEEDPDIYDEVHEDNYGGVVKGRLQRDDFVVDDGAEGYVDNGMDDWESRYSDHDVSEDEDARRKSKKQSKPKKDASKAKSKPGLPPSTRPSINAYRPAVSAEQEADFMASILGNMDNTAVTVPTIKSSRKRKSPPFRATEPDSSPFKNERYNAFDLSSDDAMEDFPSSDDISPHKRARIDDLELIPATEGLANLGVESGSDDFDKYDNLDDLMDVDDDDFQALTVIKDDKKKPHIPKEVLIKPTDASKKAGDSKPNWLSVYESLAVDTGDSLDALASTSNTTSISSASVLEEDGSLRFFWLDYLELEGRLYFTGKIKEKSTGTWVSCCVTVENIERNLYILPRDKVVEMVDDTLVDTDVTPSTEDIHDDFDTIRKQIGVKSWRGKFVKRKYVFGEEDIPRGESRWMKVVYSFSEKVIPRDACGPSISKIMGTNTSAFELLVLKRKIMGPCWINIKDPVVENKGISWCKVEASVIDPKDFNPFLDIDPSAPKEIPPLNILSLSIRTIVNYHDNKREVVCATTRVWQNMQLDDPTPPEQLKCTVNSFIRPLDKFPPKFEKQAKGGSRGAITPVQNERMLLSSLLMTIYKADPDIIVGFEFLGVSLDVLLNRMRDLKADHWSRLGRFRRSKWPNIGRQGTNLKFLNGRLLCDLASDGAKSMISSTTWSLSEMCESHLGVEREDYDPDDTAAKLDGSVDSPDVMLKFVRHCELDAHLQMAIAAKVQILPLTRQLTNLAGNSWNKTLNGGRAERNEYILLHEFHKLKYICPDKTFGKKPAVVKELQEDEGVGGVKKKGKRDKYKGGLVFEPNRGLWDKFILVMDFNSLYPSIIQEYNIDFTTVEPVEEETEDGEEERMPEPPPPDRPQGVLPRLIATLVNRRRQVKGLMKDKTVSNAQRMQYDIKQQALKLTANSMYGCLGFEYSRFYARQLAALTTYKGRSILTHTRELAENLNLQVVYGDTDSVFVNSNVTNFEEALQISTMFKNAVNEQYRLLEIDLDGVFQRLLLLQKKKYAAVKIEDGIGIKTSIEVKGLDMKRREYCALSKQVSQFILDQVLSGEPTETVVQNIHEYLSLTSDNVRGGKVKVDDFIIFKRLGKNPEDFPDGKNQPHVQVALRMKQRGGSARSGDVIPYIFCLSEGQETIRTAQADRAKHPDELRKAGIDLKIDYEHYLSQQILPPVERLCDPIEGTDRARLAECLGLDPMRYQQTSGSTDKAFSAFDSHMSDAERFREVVPFMVRCRKCQGKVAFLALNNPEQNLLQKDGAVCPSCKDVIKEGSIHAQLEVQIREHIARYYQGWTVCDDPTCGSRTRMMGVYGRRCLRVGCRGRVTFEYSDLQLYNQLRFFAFLFNSEKIEKNGELQVLMMNNLGLLQTLAGCVDKYLCDCGRRWVNLGSIFSRVSIKPKPKI